MNDDGLRLAEPPSTLPAVRDFIAGKAPTGNVRDRILYAAMQCYNLLAAGKVNINEIAKLSGVSRQTVYSYFDSKAEIIEAVTEYRAAIVSDYVELCLRGIEGGAERIEEAIIACVRFGSEDPQSRQTLETVPSNLMFVFGTRGHMPLPTIRRWENLLQDAVRQGVIRPDLEIERTVNWVVAMQTTLTARVVGLNETLAEVRCYIRSFLLEGLLPRPADK